MALSIVFFTLLGLGEKAAIERQLTEARAGARAVGIPLAVNEFQKSLGDPIAEDNAWPLYVSTIEEFDLADQDGISAGTGAAVRYAVMSASEGIRYWRRGNRNWDYNISRSALDIELAPVIRQLEQALAKPRMAPQKDWEKGHLVEFEELGEINRLADVLTYDGLRAMEEGRSSQLILRLRNLTSMAGQLWSTPLHTFQWAGLNVATNALALAKTAICHRGASRNDRTSILEVLEPILTIPDLRPGFRGMAYSGLATLNLLNSPDAIKQAELEARIVRRNPPRPELRRQIELEYLQAAKRILDRWPEDDEDIEGIRTALGKDDAAMTASLGLFSRFMRQTVGNNPEEGAFEPVLLPFESYLARVRLIKVLARAFEERDATGRFPNALPISGADAVDPFSGEPLMYATFDEGLGFRAYSVWLDREDNGGSRPRGNDERADLVLIYPDRRAGW